MVLPELDITKIKTATIYDTAFSAILPVLKANTFCCINEHNLRHIMN